MAAPSTRNILPLIPLSQEKTGKGVTALVGSGDAGLTKEKSGAAISARVASGTYVHEKPRDGAGVTELSAGGTYARIYQKVGAGVLNASASGASAGEKTFIKAGKGVIGQPTHLKTGAGVTARVGSAERFRVRPAKSGAGITVFTASGRKSLFTATGTGVLRATASGFYNRVYIRTGGNMVYPYGTLAYGDAGYGEGPYGGGFRNDGRRIGSGFNDWTEAGPASVSFDAIVEEKDGLEVVTVGYADVRVVEVVP